MARGAIIPPIITFNDALVGQYVEQQSDARSPGLGVRGDTRIPQNIDSHNQAVFPANDDCGCNDQGPMNISFEYKILVVLIVIIMIWTFVGWYHHHRTAH